jgi:hypothetical protein
MMTEFEAGVRELVARLRDFERRMKKSEDDAGALEQFVKLIRPGFGFDPLPTTPNTSFSGSIKGCNSLGTEASAISIKDGSGTTLWTGASDSVGAYSGSLYLATTTALFADVTPLTARQVARTGVSVGTLAAGSSGNVLSNVVMSPATGYVCTNFFGLPISTLLDLVDSRFGPTPVLMTWNGSGLWTGYDGTHGYSLSGPALLAGGNGTAATPTFNIFTTGVTRVGPPAVSMVYHYNPGSLTQSPPWFSGDSVTFTEH